MVLPDDLLTTGTGVDGDWTGTPSGDAGSGAFGADAG